MIEGGLTKEASKLPCKFPRYVRGSVDLGEGATDAVASIEYVCKIVDQ